jgi:hypothetical protein
VVDSGFPLEPVRGDEEGYWEDWMEGAVGVESEGYECEGVEWEGVGAEVNMLGGGALECLDSEGSWGRLRGSVEPDCYVSVTSAHEPGGTLNGVRGSWATASLQLLSNVGASALNSMWLTGHEVTGWTPMGRLR